MRSRTANRYATDLGRDPHRSLFDSHAKPVGTVNSRDKVFQAALAQQRRGGVHVTQ